MKFSIICLTYKRTQLLEESLYSVLNQTCQDYELLIINDNIFQKINFDNPKVKIINLNKKFKTIGDKRNFGVEMANGDFIIQLDDDDFLLPDYLENIKNIIKDYDLLSIQKPILYYNNNKIILPNAPLTNTFIYKRTTISKLFKYDSVNFDELTSFYDRVITSNSGNYLFKQLEQEKCGYVYRQTIDDKRKYSLANIGKKSLIEQDRFLYNINDSVGDIYLKPKWEYDYINIIKNNIKYDNTLVETNISKIVNSIIKK